MSGDDTVSPSDQVTLRQLIEVVLAEREKAELERWESHRRVHATLDSEVTRADLQRQARDAAQNEWRATVGDLTRSYVSRQLHDQLVGQLGETKERLSNLEGRLYALAGVFLAIIALVGLIEHFIPHA